MKLEIPGFAPTVVRLTGVTRTFCHAAVNECRSRFLILPSSCYRSESCSLCTIFAKEIRRLRGLRSEELRTFRRIPEIVIIIVILIFSAERITITITIMIKRRSVFLPASQRAFARSLPQDEKLANVVILRLRPGYHTSSCCHMACFLRMNSGIVGQMA